MRALVVLNPSAGSGRAGALEPVLAEAFDRRGASAVVHCTVSASASERFVADSKIQEFDSVVAAGGDGTLHAVLNGLMAHPDPERPALGVIPVGTGNAFARELDLGAGDWSAAVDLIVSGRERNVDVGRVRAGDVGFYFLNVLGAGFVVDASAAADRFRILGRSAYTAGALSAVAGLRRHRFRIELDGHLLEEEGLLVEVSNSRYTGTRFLMAPDAKLDDGLLDVVFVRAATRRRVLRLFPTIFDGTHVRFPEVSVRRARKVTITAPPGLPLLVDGEIRGELPAGIECLPGAVRVFFPS